MQAAEGIKILAINPGSTSSKLGLFVGFDAIEEYEARHSAVTGLRGSAFDAEVATYIREIRSFLDRHPAIRLDAVVGRGGFINCENARIEGGVYEVASCIDGVVTPDEAFIGSVRDIPVMDHPSNYGIPVAAALAMELGIPAFTADPVVADDFMPEARISGYKGIERKSTAHFLSVKAMAAKAAQVLGSDWNEIALVCIHMGGGITVAAYRNGKVPDNTIALLGNGPFSPQRVGSLPVGELIDLCYSGRFSMDELKYELSNRGGLMSYLGTDDLRMIEHRIEAGDEEARQILETMAYQIAKEIGAMAVAAGPDVAGLVFSGGMTRSTLLMAMIRKRVSHLARIMVFPENLEMEAMARAGVLALTGQVPVRKYGSIHSGIPHAGDRVHEGNSRGVQLRACKGRNQKDCLKKP
jgi:butyrate kinase